MILSWIRDIWPDVMNHILLELILKYIWHQRTFIFFFFDWPSDRLAALQLWMPEMLKRFSRAHLLAQADIINSFTSETITLMSFFKIW